MKDFRLMCVRAARVPGLSVLRGAAFAALLVLVPFAVSGADVLATTPWTAAFAELAGAQDIDVLAPYDMQHPPEYELRASDLRRVDEADVLVYAGYENMMNRLQSAIGDEESVSVQITTTHTRSAFEEAAMAIAEELGTEDAARENLEEVNAFMENWSEELADYGLRERGLLTHMHQEAMFEDLGVNIEGSFGPGPLEAQEIARLSGEQPLVVIDNAHNEVAGPLEETLEDVRVVPFINFPGEGGTRTILDVLRYNRQNLNEALGGRER